MTWRSRLLVGSAILAGVSIGSWMWRVSVATSPRITSGFPLLAGCSAESAWLTLVSEVDRGIAAREGIQAALDHTTSALVQVDRARILRTVPFGEGVVSSVALGPSGPWRALVIQRLDTPQQAGVLLDAGVGDEAWHVRSAHPRLIGVAFLDAARGFGWSSGQVAVTSDGGTSWKVRPLEGERLARPPSVNAPVLGTDGSLWVPTDREDGRPGGRLLRFDTSGMVREAGAWEEERVAALTLMGDGDALVALAHLSRAEFRLVRFPPAVGIQRESQPLSRNGGVEALQSVGNRVVLKIIEAAPGEAGGRQWRSSSWVSTDGGASWKESMTMRPDSTSTCIADAGIWEVTRLGWIEFTPWQR